MLLLAFRAFKSAASPDTGEPLAVMDDRLITEMHTAAGQRP